MYTLDFLIVYLIVVSNHIFNSRDAYLILRVLIKTGILHFLLQRCEIAFNSYTVEVSIIILKSALLHFHHLLNA
jgi:hypothetical protein